MIDPWFDPNRWAWLPGTALGTLGGLWGALTGILAPSGRGRALVYGLGFLLLGMSVASLIAGLAALATGQPFVIWFFLLLPGLQGGIMIPCFLPLIGKRYREAELRRMQAEDIR